MGLRFDPVGGGQFKQAVQQMIEAENQPIKLLSARKTKEDSRLKLLQEFKTKFSALEKTIFEISSFRKLRELKADLGDGEDLISVSLDKERAEPGQYLIQIDELASRTSVITNGFERPDDPPFGSGSIVFTPQEGDSIEISIDKANSTLNGIASTINRNPNAPVHAAVVKDATDPDAPWKLIFSARKDGAGNQIEIPEFYFQGASESIYIDDDREATNAKISINGFPIELESNDVSDFLPGINVHLKQANPDHEFTLTISEDYQKIGGKIKSLIENINQVLQFIYKQNAVDEKSDTSSTFAGDSALHSIEYQVRNIIHSGYRLSSLAEDEPSGQAKVITLSQLGIEFDKSGQIEFKEEKFNSALESNFESLAQVLSGPKGLAERLRQLYDTYGRPSDGIIRIKEQSLQNRIKEIDKQVEDKQRLIERKKEALVEKFSRLEASLGNLQRQQQYLSATLPGASGGNMISQLLG